MSRSSRPTTPSRLLVFRSRKFARLPLPRKICTLDLWTVVPTQFQIVWSFLRTVRMVLPVIVYRKVSNRLSNCYTVWKWFFLLHLHPLHLKGDHLYFWQQKYQLTSKIVWSLLVKELSLRGTQLLLTLLPPFRRNRLSQEPFGIQHSNI